MLRNIMSHKIRTSALLALAFTSNAAFANGGHFLVDDATITDPGTCLFETWASRLNDESMAVLQPSCTTQGRWDIAVPLAYSWSNSEFTEVGLEVKTIVSDDILGGALAFSTGVIMDTIVDEFAGGFINIPYSSALNAYWTLHLNVGTEYDHIDKDWHATWGVATTYALTQHIEVITEVAGSGAEDPIWALGARYQFNRFEVDMSLARDTEMNDTLYTLGVNVAF
ncbi:hypothetical protein [Aliidiomarina indica]|uniref:hypothetical protein n=1 Tax=Aliidiomarina indica TaxID=2749147 RepID=UPI0018907AE8|nr:hypothetical protein [Aliidiomarina indica]